MRIAIVDLAFQWPPKGGDSTDIREIAVRLRKDHDVKLFFPQFGFQTPPGKVLEDPGIEYQPIFFRRFRNFNFFQAPRRIGKAVDEWKPDRVFVGNGLYIKPYVVIELKKYRPVLRIYGHEGICLRQWGILYRNGQQCESSFLNKSAIQNIKCLNCCISKSEDIYMHELITSVGFLPTYKKTVIESFDLAETIIVSNNGIKNRLAKFSEKVKVIPGGVNTELFKPLDRNNNSEYCTVLMVGRIQSYHKGFHVLNDACKILLDQGYKIKLVVTGGDTRFSENYIQNAGWLSQEQLPSLYHAADICVVPSIWPEPFGLVALEAMSCGKPVIVSRIGGLGEIFDEGSCGLKVEPGGPGSLARKIAFLIDNPETRSKMGEEGRRIVLEKFNWDIIYDRYYKNMFES